MFTHILFPTDFSDVSRAAVSYIVQLKPTGAEEVTILHVIDSRTIDLLIYNPVVAMDLERKLREDAGLMMDDLKTVLESAGYRVKTRVEVGIPASVILRIEQDEDASLIVVSSHGKSNVSEMILGSVSEAVIRSATKPVLVIKR